MPHRSHKKSLEIVYTGKEQSADAYIIDQLTLSKNPKLCTVVTSDKKLASICRQMGAYSQTIDSFLEILEKKESYATKEKPSKDSKRELQRLLKIFTELSD